MSQLQGDTVKIAVIDGQAESCSGLMLARYQIESRFRALNNNLKIRSLFLQSEERIKSLILVNILALLVYSLIEWVYQQKRLATGMILIKCARIRSKKALKSNELSIVRDLHPIDNAHAERKKESVNQQSTDSFLNMV